MFLVVVRVIAFGFCLESAKVQIGGRHITHVQIGLDQYNGRWRIVNWDKTHRSISFSKRGFAAAAAEVLHQSWSYYVETTGLPSLYNLNGFEKDFLEVDIAPVAT